MKRFDVFISHSSKDKTLADAACAVLESRGLRCWIAPRNISGGMQWMDAIVDGIDQSQLLVLIWTSESNSSQQVLREVECALRNGLTVIPLRTEAFAASKSLEYFLSVTHWLDAMTPPIEDHLQQLANQVIQTIGTQNLVGSQLASTSVQATTNSLPLDQKLAAPCSNSPMPASSESITSAPLQTVTLADGFDKQPMVPVTNVPAIPERVRTKFGWRGVVAGLALLLALFTWGGFALLNGTPAASDNEGTGETVKISPPEPKESGEAISDSAEGQADRNGFNSGTSGNVGTRGRRGRGRVVESYFDKDNAENWTTTDQHGSSGITGSISVDPFRGQYWLSAQGSQAGLWYWKAPDRYLGNHLNKFGRYLLFNVRTQKPIEIDDRSQGPYIIVRNGDEMLFLPGRELSPESNSYSWHSGSSNFAVRFDDSLPWKIKTNNTRFREANVATNEDIKRVLSNVTELLISGPYVLIDRNGNIAAIRFGEASP